jgi:hypothetical protein
MTEFATNLRRRCRNPKCRLKLPEPVSNEREAFCCRGCYGSFYRRRCLICEQPMERETERQLVCGKRKCRNALAARCGLGRYLPSSHPISPAKKPVNKGLEMPNDDDRAWRSVAAPELTADQLRGATVPDGPNGRWESGGYQRVETRNKMRLRKHFAEQAADCLIQPHHPPVNALGGYRFPEAPAIDVRPTKFVAIKPRTTVTRDGLDIPDFLRRPALMQPDPQGHGLSCPNSKTLSARERPTASQESTRASERSSRLSRAPAPPNGVPAASDKEAA